MKFLSKFILIIIFFSIEMMAEDKPKEKLLMESKTYSGLKFRSIGPAFTSGRIADFAINPKNYSEYFVASASGGVWKTEDRGTTFSSVFDGYGAYSIGCVVIDPNNTNVVWIGTGENNHQRALGYGNGVFRSRDGGKSWENMGLKESRHIGGIVIDPRNSNTIFVAAEGSTWGSGKERGLYKTTDGGKSWKNVLFISENTGVNNVVMDTENPNILYATSEQRRRHIFTKIGGGPESAVYKSEDNGETWRKIMKGLPTDDIGGMGIAVSKVNSNVLFLIVEAAYDGSGFYRSDDKGESWNKMSNYSASGQYYNEIYCDTKDINKVYSVETFSKYTLDGGKTWNNISTNERHVDDHALWIEPENPNHFLIGGDGGVYETYDGGNKFRFVSNLPVTQLYRVNVDEDFPFYNVYGGTQDNNSFGGPSQTISEDGIVNSDWFITNGGDGFWGAVDPKNPNIVYAESQYGNIVRYDRQSEESIFIRPEPEKGEKSFKWNWNTPLVLSKHSNTTLYTAANYVFKSEDRGNTWKRISNDITSQTDRNSWKVMDKYWSYDAVQKDVSTSLWGTAVSFAESPINPNLLFVGTDDGVISVTEDGINWEQIKSFPNIPEYTYVSDILTSKFDENIVFASFDNSNRDDFKPYLLFSSDKGKSWKSIANNLPENGMIHSIEQDFKNSDLLFVGTEFGFFFSPNRGENWIQLKSGLPDIPVKDIAIQERENDLVLATYGRGFYILDNYLPLRYISEEFFKQNDNYLFPIKDALAYIEAGKRYGQGATYFRGQNPEFGATFTYYLKEVPKTKSQIRKESETQLFKESKPIQQPNYEIIRTEESELKPHLIFTILDDNNEVVRRLTSNVSSGIGRINWDLRYANNFPVNLKDNKFNPLQKSSGIRVLPGKYKVFMSLYHDGKIIELTDTIDFLVKKLENSSLPVNKPNEIYQFQKQAVEIVKSVRATELFTQNLLERVDYLKQTVYNNPNFDLQTFASLQQISKKLDDILFSFNGVKAKASQEEVPPQNVPINERLNYLIWTHWSSTSDLLTTEKNIYKILMEEFPPILSQVKKIYFDEILIIEQQLDKIGIPWTPGRIPQFNKD